MRRLPAVIAVFAALLAAPVAAGDAATDRAALERDVRILADDDMEGREAGTHGYAAAAGYVAGRFAGIGLEPGGDSGSYFQAVPLQETRDARPATLTLTINGEKIEGEAFVDFYGGGYPGFAQGVVDARLVFVGYGLDLPEYGRDDFAGINLRGKIAVRAFGAPSSLNNEELAHLRSTIKARLSERGAIGSILLWTPAIDRQIKFADAAQGAQSGMAMTWVGADGTPFNDAPRLRAGVALSPDLSRRLLAGEKFDYAALLAAEQTERAAMPSFRMKARARIEFANTIQQFTDSNVIGILPGTDPALADQYVVLTGHLDHLGAKPTEEEGDDEIFNGAMDNATGIAAMLEVARLLKANPPRRPVMFVALAAEEQGLLGSSYHAHHPGLPDGASLAVNVNLDMPILTYPFEDVNAFGAERSNVFPYVKAAVEEAGLMLSPDPNPELGLFVRSDQYSYIQQGIPAIFLKTGTEGAGAEGQAAFLARHYHQPSDEAGLVAWEQLGRFADVNYLIARNVANMDARPAWLEGDFFGTLFEGPMAAPMIGIAADAAE